MKVTFVSHASILVESAGCAILSDPWYTGKVFNDGWALLSPPHPVPFSSVDYIWISHEHPDHFNFATLRQVPEADRRRIRVLYQRHASPRIISAIHRLGYSNTIELPLYRWFDLTPDVQVLCGSSGKMDSFLATRSRDACVLNLNDCCFNRRQLRYIKRLVGDVSVLFAQFSFANWVGNDRDELGDASRKLADLRQFLEVFQPSYLVPFASFIYFCNAENQRMNAWMNTPQQVADLQLPRVAFMYPGDQIDVRSPRFASDNAVERYSRDGESLCVDPTPAPVAISSVVEAIQERLLEMHRAVARQPLLRAYIVSAGLKLATMQPFTIYIHDLAKMVTIDAARARCRLADATRDESLHARYVMCSQVAWYTFAFPWGANTTEVSGMYLDREFGRAGQHPFFAVQAAISSESLNVPSAEDWRRVVAFWWHKRAELFYRLSWVSAPG